MEPRDMQRDYRVNPFIVIWEVTRACALKCLHCRAEAQYHPDPRQLTFEEGKKLIDDVAQMDQPLFVFTGGDPLMRPDPVRPGALCHRGKRLVRFHDAERHPESDPRSGAKSEGSGAVEVGFQSGRFLCGNPRSFSRHKRVLPADHAGIEYLREYRLPIQINTTVSRYNLHDLEAIAEKVSDLGAVLWSVFFLVPVGRGMEKDVIFPGGTLSA